MTDTAPQPPLLPTRVVDSHFHLIDTTVETSFNGFQRSDLGANLHYLPKHYQQDVIDPLTAAGLEFVGAVHVEAIPDDGLQEVEWVVGQPDATTFVKAIVASCDLTRPNAHATLASLKQHRSTLVRGIRWILDVASDENDQAYVPDTPTHLATKRHDVREFGTIDYLKVPAFAQGFAGLEAVDFSFDLQCAPCQLIRAAQLAKQHPKIPVCIDHLGKLQKFMMCSNQGDDDTATAVPPPVDEAQLEVWKQGMQAMAQAHDNVYCKLSMLGHVIPNWHLHTAGREKMRQLLRLVVMDWFGPQRCMAGLNWHINAAVSDSGGLANTGPAVVEFVELLSRLLPDELTLEQRNDIFANNASRFYRIATSA